MKKESVKVFISHASADTLLAEYLEEVIRRSLVNVDVFRTTRIGQIPSGKDWFASILSELRRSDRYLVLLTPWSMARPWVCFETGAAWMTERKLVAVVAGGMAKADVVEPLKYLQLLSIDNQQEAEMAFTELGGALLNGDAFVRRVQALSAECRNASLTEEGWEQVDIDGQVYAWEGPLEELSEGNFKTIGTDKYQDLRSAGLTMVSEVEGNLLGQLARGFSILYLIDLKRRRKHKLLTRDAQVLLVRRLQK